MKEWGAVERDFHDSYYSAVSDRIDAMKNVEMNKADQNSAMLRTREDNQTKRYIANVDARVEQSNDEVRIQREKRMINEEKGKAEYEKHCKGLSSFHFFSAFTL